MAASKDPGRRPTHRLSVKSRTDRGQGVIGAGWMREDGSISISLNPCVVLSHDDDVMIFLFPNDEERRPRSRPRAAQATNTERGGAAVIGPGDLMSDDDEEIPF
jgi:hypothetical protein